MSWDRRPHGSRQEVDSLCQDHGGPLKKLPGEPVKRFASVLLNHPFIDGMFHICSMNYKPNFEMGYPHGKHHLMIPYRLSQFWGWWMGAWTCRSMQIYADLVRNRTVAEVDLFIYRFRFSAEIFWRLFRVVIKTMRPSTYGLVTWRCLDIYIYIYIYYICKYYIYIYIICIYIYIFCHEGWILHTQPSKHVF